MSSSDSAPPGAFTVDLEAWFQAHNLNVARSSWNRLPLRLDGPVLQILDMLSGASARATFFVLGWVAERRPDLIRLIRRRGHEIASHGYDHVALTQHTPRTFHADLHRSMQAIEDAVGEPVRGFRAPNYSLNHRTLWALEVMIDCGIEYDSSIYPTRAPHGRYGMEGVSLGPFPIRDGLWEFPLPVWQVAGRRCPAGTGGYLRCAPLSVTLATLRQYQRARRPLVLNVHPWELDPGQPRWPTSLTRRWLHYTNLSRTARVLARLLSAHPFTALEALHGRLAGTAKLLRQVNANRWDRVPTSGSNLIPSLNSCPAPKTPA